MKTSTWHLEHAKVVLEKWYGLAEDFIKQANAWDKFFFYPGKGKQEGISRRLALKCKTRGLIYHDHYKLLLEKEWRKYPSETT